MCAAGLPYQIAIIGAGSIGSALAGHLILAGNKVTIGTRRPDAFTPPDYQREDIDYPVRTIEEAIDGAEVAILAIPNAAVAPFAEVYRDRLAGAILIDPSKRVPDVGVFSEPNIGSLGLILGLSSPSRVAASSSGTFGGVGEAWNRSRSVSYQLCCCTHRASRTGRRQRFVRHRRREDDQHREHRGLTSGRWLISLFQPA